MNGSPFYSLTLIVIAAIILVYLIRTWQIKIQAGKEQAYQKMSEELLSLQRESVDFQKKIFQDLQELNHRMKNVEKILQEVE